MVHTLPFSEDVRDATQEICNVAMGVAAEALAEFSGVFVELPIPKVRLVAPADVTESLAGLRGDSKISAVLRQLTLGESTHYALVAITEEGLDDLARQRDCSIATDADAQALLQQLAEVITEHCLPTLAEQLDIDKVQMAPVQLLQYNRALDDLTIAQLAAQEKLLAIEINYHLEQHPFNCDLVLMLPQAALPDWIQRIEALL